MATPEKVIILLLDGAADRPCEALEGKTPLEAAFTPNLDLLSSSGTCGLIYPIEPFFAPSTDLAHFVLFGYSIEDYPGRGWVEALGNGIHIKSEELVMRDLLVSSSYHPKEGFLIERENTPYEEEECQLLSEAISKYENGNFTAKHIYTGKRHGFLIISGPISEYISDTDPFASNLPIMESQPLAEAEDKEKAKNTSEFLNSYTKWAIEVLSSHEVNRSREKRGLPPINSLVSKWPGKEKKVDKFFDATGFKAVIVARGGLFKGFSKMIDVHFDEVPVHKNAESEIEYLISRAMFFLKQEFDFIFLHTKIPDDVAHKKDPSLKKRILEEIDAGIKGLIDSGIYENPEIALVITSDHATPSSGSLIHSGEAAPLCVLSPNLIKDNVDRFSEKACANGALGILRGKDFMPLILNLTDRIRYLGSRAFPKPWLSTHSKNRINPLKFEP